MPSDPPFALLDLGDVLVTTHPDRPYLWLQRLTGVPGEDVRQRLDESGSVAALETGVIDVQQFLAAARAATGLSVVSDTDFADAFTSVVGDLDPLLTPVVGALAREGRLAFVSNTSPLHWAAIEQRLAHAGIDAPAILSFRVGVAKPDRRFFTEIPEQWRTAGVFIDDRAENVAAAQRVGIAGHIHHSAAETAVLLRGLLARGANDR